MKAALAFFPPDPPSYTVRVDSDNPTRHLLSYTDEQMGKHELYSNASRSAEVHWVTPRKGCHVPVVWVHREPDGDTQGHAPLVLLYCHGNATDIGIMMGPFFEMSRILQVDVVGLEYAGYGTADGELNTGNVFGDIEAAYVHITNSGVPPSRIVAYGQSIGSAPSVYLASRYPVGGLILHSPLSSALQVIDPKPNGCCQPSCLLCCLDIFRNDWRISSVTCPTFIMHGEMDGVVPIHSAKKLHSRCKPSARRTPYFPQKAGHNDIVESDPHKYYELVMNFLAEVRERATGAPKQVAMPISVGNVVEPKSGPDDGRYEQLRQGDVFGGIGPGAHALGRAREVHVD